MAFEAKAEDRETLGLISIPIISSVSGLTANWTLHPPAKSPIPFIILIARFLISWYTVSGRVIAGATVMESPVWIPIASKFSIEQIIITFPILSLSNSNSYSFHPKTLCSTRTSCTGDLFNPWLRALSKSFSSSTNPPPDPPKVNEGLITNGKPISCAISLPLKYDLAISPLHTFTFSSFIFNLKSSLSSVVLIASTFTPIILTLYFSQIPALSHSIAKFRAVCPPIVGRTASILCFSKIWIIDFFVRGFK